MKGKGRDVIVGLVILILLVLGIYAISHRKPSLPPTNPVPTPVSKFEQNLENTFNIKVPDNVVKADLKNTTDGGSQGVATQDYQNGKYSYTVIADLDEPQPGYFYQGWLVNGNDTVLMGTLYQGKGGWMVTLDTTKNLNDHKTVWVTLEKVNDKNPEKHILEGSF